MLTKKQVKEIRAHLDRAQNPIFFFDNDQDGLCSFLLLQRFLERGKGVPVKSFPDMDESYFRKVDELNADYIFILDKPVVSDKFWAVAEQRNIPVVWIDHHDVQCVIPDFVDYYNPLDNKGGILGKFSRKQQTAEPVTTLCYQITQKKDDMWLAVVGSISDKFVPKFYFDFKKEHPDLVGKSDEAFGILYGSEIGRIARMMGFGLKDRTTNVISMLRFLMKVKTPYDVLDVTSKNRTMHERFDQVEVRYNHLLERAKEIADEEDILFFKYGGDLSISADVSNALSYMYPGKTIVVIYVTGVKANISLRGKGIRTPLLKTIEEIEGGRGGGHEDAVGAQVPVKDIEFFKERLSNYIKEYRKV